MRTGHLFAGIDGLGLGLEPHGFRTVWFSEYEDAPSQVLAHHYPDVPNHGDITAIDWSKVEPVDVLTGGFPCQDLSYAGKGAGIKEGTRSGLWFEYVRAIRALRPRLVIVENVSALTSRGLDIVLGDLHESGFDAEWSTLRASDVGAAHRRERLFIVAVAADPERGGRGPGGFAGVGRPLGSGAVDPDDTATTSHAGPDAADRDGVGRVHGEPGVVAAEAGVDAFGDAPAGCGEAASDGQSDGRPAWGAEADERPGGTGLAPCDREAASDANEVRLEGPEHVGQRFGLNELNQYRSRKATSDPDHTGLEGWGREASGRAVQRSAGQGEFEDWGEFGPAIRRWEKAIGRPATAPTVDGRLSADFVEWHMGFPPGWTSMLSRNQRLKALGNAVVPQVADVIGRWAVQLTVEVAA